MSMDVLVKLRFGAKAILGRKAASGRSLPVMVTKPAGRIRCNLWSERMQMTGQVECKRVVKWSVISHLRRMLFCSGN